MGVIEVKRESRSERGSAVYEMAVVIAFMAILISGVFSLGPFVHMSFATRQTAYDCAVAAAQTLDARQGRMQGEVAGKMTAAGYSMVTSNITFEVAGNWARNGQVACTATYHIPTGNFPMKMVVPLPSTYTYTVRLPIQIWHSTWR
jgi:Flp pilus assembly protein TadG